MNAYRADRLSGLPPYLFVEIDRKKRQAIEAGRDVIDFGVGDPDGPTPDFIVDRLVEAVRDPANHSYPAGIGMLEFRQAAARFFLRRFGVELDPHTEIIALLGSKEGIGHLPTAIVNPGDTVLVPEPGYPVYASGVIFAGGKCHTMRLSEANGWLPVLEDIPLDVRRQCTLMWLNYPNNPTAGVAPLSFFEEAVAFGRKYNILIAQDAAYSEVHFGHQPPSILQVEGAKNLAIEFHSLSKTFNMTGWRIAFAVGHRGVLAALAEVKSNLDSGVFQAIQQAGITALDSFEHPHRMRVLRRQIDLYRRRRDLLVAGLREAGWRIKEPQATFYIWASCPAECDSMAVASRMLEEAGVVVIPGVGFGSHGEGYVRFALTITEEKTREAVRRLAKLSW